MCVHPSPPGVRAAVCLAVTGVCLPVMGAGAALSSSSGSLPSSAAVGTTPSMPPWVVKATPVHGNTGTRIEIRYRHHSQPFVVRDRAAREVLIRPTIRVASTGGQAWLGLDADLAWEGRCSAAGGWLVIDADRSGPGLATANLRYNLRTRRLVLSSGSAEVHIDLTNGSVKGPAAMVGPCRNLRDHFLSHGNQPFCVKVSDRAGCSGVVWIFDDLASVAVGPAEEPWFTPDDPWPADLSTTSWPASDSPGTPSTRETTPSLPLLEPPRPVVHRRDRGDQAWAFGRQSFSPVRSVAASSARPTRLSSWPGKALPSRPMPGLAGNDAVQTVHRLEALGSRWRGQAERIRFVVDALDRTRAGLGLAVLDEESVNACAESIARACGFNDAHLTAVADGIVHDLVARPGVLNGRLRRLEQAIHKAMVEALRSVQTARGLTLRAADLAEAERNCNRLTIGTSLNDEVLCLFMDLATRTGPMPPRRRLMALVAERMLGRARDDALARLWNHVDLLATGTVEAGLDQPWGRMPMVTNGRGVDGLNLDASADSALAALASAIYEDPLTARHFQRHLARRFPNRLAITPAGVAALVEELALAGVAVPTGLEQLLAMCGSPRQERRAVLGEAGVKARASWLLIDRVGKLIDQAVKRCSDRLAAARRDEPAYRSAYTRQQAEVLGLVRWVCETYADQIFGRVDLTPRQRKHLILSTAAWWVRQWRMDLCWVPVTLEVEVQRRDDRYSWRVHDVRIHLLDQPDPEAVAEERMACTPPPRAFPIGRMRLATGRVIEPRTLADIEALEDRPPVATGGPSSGPGSAVQDKAADGVASQVGPALSTRDRRPRMIVPESPQVILASTEVPEPVGPTPFAGAASAAAGQPVDAGAAARSAPTRPEASPIHRVEAIQVPEPELPVPGDEMSLPVTLRPGPATRPRHLAVHADQLVRLMGVLHFGDASARPVCVWVDLHADDPGASGLAVTTSPQAADQGRAALVELASGRWVRRAIRWPDRTSGSGQFLVTFRAPAPTRQPQTLTMMLSLAWDKTDRPEGLAEQTYVFHLLDRPGRGKQMAAARTP